MTSSGVVILELLFPSGIEVGTYAIAAQTGGFISLIGTSTNRYYLPMMVVMIECRDKKAIQRLMNQRNWVVGGLILIITGNPGILGSKNTGFIRRPVQRGL